MPDDLSIREILQQLTAGNIRIPAFQRGFVWDAEKVAYFMDGFFKGYPFGSLLFWRTKAQLKTERQLGPFVLPDRDPEYPSTMYSTANSALPRFSEFSRLI
jgi:Protein of unknown function DUF262